MIENQIKNNKGLEAFVDFENLKQVRTLPVNLKEALTYKSQSAAYTDDFGYSDECGPGYVDDD